MLVLAVPKASYHMSSMPCEYGKVITCNNSRLGSVFLSPELDLYQWFPELASKPRDDASNKSWFMPPKGGKMKGAAGRQGDSSASGQAQVQ